MKVYFPDSSEDKFQMNFRITLSSKKKLPLGLR